MPSKQARPRRRTPARTKPRAGKARIPRWRRLLARLSLRLRHALRRRTRPAPRRSPSPSGRGVVRCAVCGTFLGFGPPSSTVCRACHPAAADDDAPQASLTEKGDPR